MTDDLRRDKLEPHWDPQTWDDIDKAVHDETKRICIARRFLPPVPVQSDELNAPADTIVQGDGTSTGNGSFDEKGLLSVAENAVTPLIEIAVEFGLTLQQVKLVADGNTGTATTLAIRATNLLIQGEDLLCNQGNAAVTKHGIFTDGTVKVKAGPGPEGLADVTVLPDRAKQTITVKLLSAKLREGNAPKYGETLFEAVADGYSRLQQRGHYGPYALELQTVPYADAFAPLPSTLIMPADRIKPLVNDWFFGTGTLPELTGVLLSLGGNTMDMVIGRDAIVAYMQVDNSGNYRFRVFERFALRDKDKTGRIVFQFEAP
jgi:uncharacterized linocin/CFP29 family protein